MSEPAPVVEASEQPAAPPTSSTARRRRKPRPPPPPGRPSHWSWRERVAAGLLVPVAIFLGWRVFTLGLADLWATSDPEAALKWRPNDPQALIAAAENAVAARDFDAADALARRAIADCPLDGRGYRVIGVGKDFRGDTGAAGRLFAIALQRSPRDVVARNMLARYAGKAGDFAAALHQIDVLLRIRPDLAPNLLPKLVAASSNPELGGMIDRLLVERPPWRLAFLRQLATSSADADAIARVFAGRGGDDPLPPPAIGTEADLLLRRQLADHDWGRAYFTWVSTLSTAERTRLGNLYDGDFDFQPSSRGFDWRIPDQGAGFDVRTGSGEGLTEHSGLQVRFNGLPLDYRPVSQLLILGPGHYRLSGMGGASGIDTEQGGLAWTVSCAEGDGQALGSSGTFSGDMPVASFQMEFDVPPTGCAAQWLRLDFSGGMLRGQPLHGVAVFDGLKVDRVPAPAAGPAADPATNPTAGTSGVAQPPAK